MVNKRNQGSSYNSSFKIGVKPDKKQMNKRGWIRIVEALVAIMLIAGFLILLMDNQEDGVKDISAKVYMTENAILREVQSNSTYRTHILGMGDGPIEFEDFDVSLKNHITSRVPEYLNCTGKLCDFDINPICDISSSEETIYVRSVMIAADADTYDPKLLKIFCWTA